jgi:hypothetical protein
MDGKLDLSMIEHPTENQLERLILTPDDLGLDEKERLESHLADCSLCREHMLKLKEFYRGVSSELENSPTQRDRDAAQAILSSGRKALPSEALQRQPDAVLDAYAEVIEPYRRPFIHRFVRYVRVHPLQFAGASSLALAALAVLFLMFRTSTVKDLNPSYQRIKGQVLYIFNKSGEVLWTRPADGFADDSSQYTPKRSDEFEGPAEVLDIDGDSKNEVLFHGYKQSALSDDTLWCFNADGTIRWKHGMGEAVNFGGVNFSRLPDWEVGRSIAIRRSRGARTQLFMWGSFAPYWPTKLAELDPLTGRELQSYWNRGGLSTTVEADIDGDGIRELVCGGTNDHFNSACVIVFDPANVRGAGTSEPEILSAGLGRGSEKYYLLLPRTSFGEALSPTEYNFVSVLQVSEHGNITLQTDETPGSDIDHPPGIVYSFDREMRPTFVLGNDYFLTEYERAWQKGLVHEKLSASYYENLKNSIRYWDGEKFVKEPTMNKYHLASKPTP